MLNFIRNKEGGAVIILVLILGILLSSILIIAMDVNHTLKLSRDIDIALDVATKAASGKINQSLLQSGVFQIDENLAANSFKYIVERNFLQSELTGYLLTEEFIDLQNRNFRFVSPSTGNTIIIFLRIVQFPSAGFSLGDATHSVLIPPTSRPVAAAFAVVSYNRTGLWGASNLYIRRVAVSQLVVN